MQDNQYYELSLRVDGDEADILVAQLGEAGYEAFVEEDGRLKAYIQAGLSNTTEAKGILKALQDDSNLEIRYSLMPAVNWNKTWEDNFEPVVIAGKLQVRAEHHVPDPSCPIQIIIQPKMSFGTGHHATTALVAEYLLELDVQNKYVVDAGCGTGILAILAQKLGATGVEAFDHEAWAAENSLENAANNQAAGIHIECADLFAYLPIKPADLILSNITRNLNIEAMPIYIGWANGHTDILASGFYEVDLETVSVAAQLAGFTYQSHKVQNDWCAAHFSQVS